MIRVVRTQDGLKIDPTGKIAGRGAYLHDRYDCWDRGMKGALAHALKMTINAEEMELIEKFMSTLPQDAEIAGTGE